MQTHPDEVVKNQKNYLICLMVLMVLSLLLAVLFSKDLFFQNPGTAGLTLQNKINPNKASAASLMRLPGVGRAKADAIISYRNKNSSSIAKPFKNVNDLDKITGFGPKTIKDINNFLIFD